MPFVTRSQITVSLGKDMSDFFVGSNVFENVKVVGYKDVPLLSFSSSTEYIKDGAFMGVVDFNGEKIQTNGCEDFALADANGKLVAKSGPAGFKTWKCKVEAPGVWCFRILNGGIRFFPPLNGIFASCPENLPRMAQ